MHISMCIKADVDVHAANVRHVVWDGAMQKLPMVSCLGVRQTLFYAVFRISGNKLKF